MGRLIYVREVSFWCPSVRDRAHKIPQDRETEPRFTSGAPARGGFDGGYGARGGYGGGGGGYGGGGPMGGGMGMQGGGGRQIFVSNVCAPCLSVSVIADVPCSFRSRSGGRISRTSSVKLVRAVPLICFQRCNANIKQ